jgi:hypothetical protein
MTPEAGAPRILHLERNFYSLGLLLDFLSSQPGFGDYPLRQMVKSLRHQIDRRTHLCALVGEGAAQRVVGYCGWLEVAAAQGQLWLAGLATLKPLPRGSTVDAFAMTLVAAEDGQTLRRLMRHARALNRGRQVFFKRDYGGKAGAGKPSRKATVRNA